MSAIVCVDDYETFPEEIIRFLSINASLIKKSVLKVIERECVTDLSLLEFNCLYKKTNSELMHIVDYFESIFNNHQFVGYHYTRIDSPSSITENGLMCLNWNYYSRYLTYALEKYGASASQIADTLSLVWTVYNGSYGTREGNLCFFTPLSTLDISPAYAKYGLTVGGEVAVRAIKKRMPDILRLLQENGIPVIVEFLFSYKEILLSDKRPISWLISKSLISHFVFGKDIQITFDGTIQSNIPQKDIIRIIKEEELPYRSVFEWLSLPH